ncbi:Raftlin, partial [Ophiophagus hannah]
MHGSIGAEEDWIADKEAENSRPSWWRRFDHIASTGSAGTALRSRGRQKKKAPEPKQPSMSEKQDTIRRQRALEKQVEKNQRASGVRSLRSPPLDESASAQPPVLQIEPGSSSAYTFQGMTDGMFIFEDPSVDDSRSVQGYDAIVVEQWTILDGVHIQEDYIPLLNSLAVYGWQLTCVLPTPIVKTKRDGKLATKQIVFLQRPFLPQKNKRKQPKAQLAERGWSSPDDSAVPPTTPAIAAWLPQRCSAFKGGSLHLEFHWRFSKQDQHQQEKKPLKAKLSVRAQQQQTEETEESEATNGKNSEAQLSTNDLQFPVISYQQLACAEDRTLEHRMPSYDKEMSAETWNARQSGDEDMGGLLSERHT